MSTTLLSTATFLALARLLRPEDFGIVALAAVYVLALGVFADLGFDRAVVQLPEVQPGDADTCFFTGLAIAGSFAVTLFLAAPLLDGVHDAGGELVGVLRILSLTLISNSVGSTSRALAMRALRFKGIAVIGLAANLVAAALAVGMAAAGMGAASLAWQQVVASSLASLAIIAYARWRPTTGPSLASLRRIFAFGAFATLTECAIFLSRNADNFIIGATQGSVALGFYAVAYRCYFLLYTTVGAAFVRPSLAVFSAAGRDGRERLQAAVLRFVRASSLIAVPAFALAALVAHDLIPIVLGDQWGRSLDIAVLLFLSGAVATPSLAVLSLAQAVGRARWAAATSAVVAAIDVLAFWIGSHWEAEGVAVAHLLKTLIETPLLIAAGATLVGLSAPRWGRAAIGVIAATTFSLLGGAAAVVLLAPGPVRLVVAGAVFGALYLGSTCRFLSDEWAELRRLAAMLPRPRRQPLAR